MHVRADVRDTPALHREYAKWGAWLCHIRPLGTTSGQAWSLANVRRSQYDWQIKSDVAYEVSGVLTMSSYSDQVRRPCHRPRAAANFDSGEKTVPILQEKSHWRALMGRIVVIPSLHMQARSLQDHGVRSLEFTFSE